MNYQQYLKHEYTYNAPSMGAGNCACVCFFDSGSYVSFPYEREDTIFDYSFEDMFTYVANYCNRNYSDNGNLVAYNMFYDTGNLYESFLFLTGRVDYIVHGGTYIYNGFSFDKDDDLSGVNDITNYYLNNTNNFSDYTYGRYQNQLAQTKSVFDLSNLNYTNGDNYKYDTIPIRGENTSFYKSGIYTFGYNSSQPSCYFAYGSPYSDIANSEYERGYGNGYASGWTEGQQYGYEQGINGGIDTNTATAFSYIGGAFNAVSGILAIEVLPHITLGLCFSIPLVLVLIMTIFKLVKK